MVDVFMLVVSGVFGIHAHFNKHHAFSMLFSFLFGYALARLSES